MPIEEVRHLFDRERVEYVAYYVRMAGFNTLGETFVAQFCCILLRHCESCDTICDIIQTPALHGVQSLLDKDPRFVAYVTSSAWELVQAKMENMSSSNQLKMPVADMNPQRLRTFLLVEIDRVYKQEAPFIRSLLQTCVNSHDHIIDDPNLDLADDDIPLLRNNMVNPPNLEEQNSSKWNRAFISIVSLALLCYGRNERSNMFQRIIGHYAFSSNIPKQSVKLFYQMGIIVSYESI